MDGPEDHTKAGFIHGILFQALFDFLIGGDGNFIKT